MSELKENLTQQFDIERENLVQIHSSNLEKEKEKSKIKFETCQKELEDLKRDSEIKYAEDAEHISQLKSLMNSETSKAGTLNGQIEYLKNREKELEEAKSDLSENLTTLQDQLNISQKQIEELNVSKCFTILKKLSLYF